MTLVALGTFLPSWAPADDLAALARKERARRASIAKPAKVITEDSIKEMADKGSGSLTTLEADPSAPVAADPIPIGSPDAQRADWKLRADTVRAQLKTAQQKLEDLEQTRARLLSDLAPLSAAEAQDPMRLQKRQVAVAEMGDAIALQRELVVEAQKAVAALEDSARRNGVPPGWLR